MNNVQILVAIRITDTDPDPYPDNGKTCLGGGMHCLGRRQSLGEEDGGSEV